MEDRSQLEGALVRVLQILHDYADALVLVGGWVPYLHLTSGRAAVSAPRISLTSEADLLVPGGLGRRAAGRARSHPRFVVNKANTFHLRGGPDAEMKAAKDLLYLRDIMAAGHRVESVLEDDLENIAASGGRSYAALRRAGYHLRSVAPRYSESVAEILSERDGVEFAAAGGDVEGYLTDVAESVGGWEGPDGEIRR